MVSAMLQCGVGRHGQIIWGSTRIPICVSFAAECRVLVFAFPPSIIRALCLSSNTFRVDSFILRNNVPTPARYAHLVRI